MSTLSITVAGCCAADFIQLHHIKIIGIDRRGHNDSATTARWCPERERGGKREGKEKGKTRTCKWLLSALAGRRSATDDRTIAWNFDRCWIKRTRTHAQHTRAYKLVRIDYTGQDCSNKPRCSHKPHTDWLKLSLTIQANRVVQVD